MSRVFRHGDLRLYLLVVLDEAPRYGYEIIRLLEERFEGLYSPSAGTIYPRLAALEQEGLVEHIDDDDRRVYRITDAGREELGSRRRDVGRLDRDLARSARELAREVRQQVRESVAGVRSEVESSIRDSVQASAAQVRAELRDAARSGRTEAVASGRRWEARRRADGPAAEYLRLLRAELDLFAAEVMDIARGVELDLGRLSALRVALIDARGKAATAVRGGDAPATDAAVDPVSFGKAETATAPPGAEATEAAGAS